MKTIAFYLSLIFWGCSLISCGALNTEDFSIRERIQELPIALERPTSLVSATSKLAEVTVPKRIEELNKNFERFNPQILIVSPQTDRVFDKTDVDIELKIQNLSLFKDDKLGLGPHLNLIVDNRFYKEIYDLEEAITIEDLTPGTHTLRVFATRPWGESFKNQGAYAQATFHILTKTNSNNPDRDLPLLTYNQPQGTYSAEPIMLDFFLTNAPLHVVAQENPDDDIKDWRIRVSVNGESFILDRWQPIYLKGFAEGNNWVQLELLDEDGNNIENVFNNTVGLVTYAPRQQDSLGELVRGEIPLEQAKSIVEQNYYIQPVEASEIIEEETAETTLPTRIENLPQETEIDRDNDLLEESATIFQPIDKDVEQSNEEIESSTEDNTETISNPEEIAAEKSKFIIIEEKTETLEIEPQKIDDSSSENRSLLIEEPRETIDSVEANVLEIIEIETPTIDSIKETKLDSRSNIADRAKTLWNELRRKLDTLISG